MNDKVLWRIVSVASALVAVIQAHGINSKYLGFPRQQ
jgi:hypothetical protein